MPLRSLQLTAFVFAAMLGATAHAQNKPVALKLSSWVPAQHPLNPALSA